MACSCGQLLIDPTQPDTVVAKMVQPWLSPAMPKEHDGLVPNVTFVGGLVHFRGEWMTHYGQGDTSLGVAVSLG